MADHTSTHYRAAQGRIHPEFNWTIYADATLAGLSALVPVPYIDSAFEAYFRRRMARTIADQRSRALHPAALRALQQQPVSNIVQGLVALPVELSLGLVKRFSRKVLYFLAVKSAINALTFYWRRAYLLDYMVRMGHLSGENTAPAAVDALNHVLAQSGSGPFAWLAKQVIEGTPQALLLLWRARHGDASQEDALLLDLRSRMAEQWPDLSSYLQALTRRYEEEYHNRRNAMRAAPAAGGGLPRLVEQTQKG